MPLSDRAWLTPGHLSQIAETFIWQVNPDDEKKCKLLAGLVKTGISAAFAGIAVIPVVGPATTAAAKAGQKFFEISAGVSASATSFVGFLYINANIEDGADRDLR